MSLGYGLEHMKSELIVKLEKLSFRLLFFMGLLVVTGFLVFFVAEIMARAIATRSLADPAPAGWLEMIADLPEKDQFLADRRNPLMRKLKYHDYHLYSMHSYSSETIKITDYYCSRSCPDSFPPEKAAITVWIFGGSTMQNLETTDKRTIANQVAIRLRECGIPASVRNFGVGSFQTSMELIKFQDLLRRVPSNQWPTFCVYYDGYNDSSHSYMFGAGNIQADLGNKLRFLVEQEHGRVVRYAVAEWLAERSVLCRGLFSRIIRPRHVFDGVVNDDSNENLMKAISTYELNLQFIRSTCRVLDIEPLFVFQPVITSKKSLVGHEKIVYESMDAKQIRFVRSFYDSIVKRMKTSPEFLDLSSILDDDGTVDFYDLGHTGPYVGQKIGFAIGDAIAIKVRSRRKNPPPNTNNFP